MMAQDIEFAANRSQVLLTGRITNTGTLASTLVHVCAASYIDCNVEGRSLSFFAVVLLGSTLPPPKP
jgi:hypothetical protein